MRCWLLELLAEAFHQEGNNLTRIADYVKDSDTGRWTAHYAIDHPIPLSTITQSLEDNTFRDATEEKQISILERRNLGCHNIDTALQTFDEETYEIREDCHEPINGTCLNLHPFTRRGILCHKQVEIHRTDGKDNQLEAFSDSHDHFPDTS